MPKYPFANFSLFPRAWTLVVLESGRIDFTQTIPDKSAMTEAEIVRQVAALPQAAQRRVVAMITGLKPKAAMPNAVKPKLVRRQKRLTVLERNLGVVRGGPHDLSTNKAYRRAWQKPVA